jgi:hypothetical protein
MYVEYSANNSGGKWWLTDEDWKSLEGAGWEVEWVKDWDNDYFKPDTEGRWLGALAKKATRRGLGLREAVAEWERATSACSTDAGCPCCGPPHHFTEYEDDGSYVRSGPETEYVASWD